MRSLQNFLALEEKLVYIVEPSGDLTGIESPEIVD
jgi:hypothetical protein